MAEPATWLDPDDLYADLHLPAGTPERPYVAVNMVSTVDGKAVVGGGAGSIGSATDHRLMRRIRAAVDAVLVGAATVRAEQYGFRVGPDEAARRVARGLEPQPLPVVLSASGDLPYGRGAFRGVEPRPIVFVGEAALRAHPERASAARPFARLVAAGEMAIDLSAVVARLARDSAVSRLLVEGGPSTNQAFFAAGLVDELFLTLAPRIAGGRSKTIVELDAPPPLLDLARLDLVSAAQREGELYLRYRVRSSAR